MPIAKKNWETTLLHACGWTSCRLRMLTQKMKYDLGIRRLTSKKSDVSTNDVRENTNLNIGVIIIRCRSMSLPTSRLSFVSTHLKLPCS